MGLAQQRTALLTLQNTKQKHASCIPSSLGKSPVRQLGPTSVLPEPCNTILKCLLLLAAVSRRRQRETHWASIQLLTRSPDLRSPLRRCESSKALEHLTFKEQPPPLSTGARNPCCREQSLPLHTQIRLELKIALRNNDTISH